MRKLLLALALLCFTGPALAQNTQCSNRPAADSSNACANTRFVSTAIAAIPVPPISSLALASGQIIVGQVTGFAGAVSMSGDCGIVASGAITCTKVNGNTVTAGTGTLTIAAGKVETFNNTLTFAGTDGKTVTHNASTTFAGVDGKTETFNNTLTYGGTDGSSIAFGAGGTVTYTIASGAKALATGAIASATCTTAQTDTATGAATTDAVNVSFNADPTAVTGYIPSTSGMLTIFYYPTANLVNFKVCNNTLASITPGAVTINWRITR